MALDNSQTTQASDLKPSNGQRTWTKRIVAWTYANGGITKRINWLMWWQAWTCKDNDSNDMDNVSVRRPANGAAKGQACREMAWPLSVGLTNQRSGT